MKKIICVCLAVILPVLTFCGCSGSSEAKPFTGSDYTIKEVDLSEEPEELVGTKYDYLYELTTVDDSLSYMAHPDSVLLKNGDIFTAYPAGHGKGAILTKISEDGGITWQENPNETPESWVDSQETPTVYRLNFKQSDTPDKLILISANPQWGDEETDGGFNCSVSTDEGETWSEFETFYDVNSSCPVVPIVAMASLVQLKEDGEFVDKWMGVFHDASFYNYKTILTFDEEGNMQWSKPEKYFSEYREIEEQAAMCEVQIIRSDEGVGDELCLIARSNTKEMNSLISFSEDEGETWSYPKEAPAALNGERHKAVYTQDGRLFITFRSIERGEKAEANATKDTTGGYISEGWVAWVGTYDDLKNGTEGQYRIKLAHVYADGQKEIEYYAGADTGYSGNVLLEDGTIVTSSYGQFDPKNKTLFKGMDTYIVSKRINLNDIDELVEKYGK